MGAHVQENIYRNFGMPQPNGYRKALRFMRHADHFGFPIVTFVDTPGAYAGKNAEELGQVHYLPLAKLDANDLPSPVRHLWLHHNCPRCECVQRFLMLLLTCKCSRSRCGAAPCLQESRQKHLRCRP